MKIIQRFKDVYDHIFFMYGQDPKIVWDRKTQQVEKALPAGHRTLSGHLEDGRLFKGQVLIVNQTVLVVYVDEKGVVLPNLKPNLKPKRWSYWSRDYAIEYLDTLKGYTDKYKAPIVLVGSYVDERGYYQTGVFTNPQLNIGGEVTKSRPEVRVFQSVDPQMLYTEINAWFGRHASEPEMVQLSDKDKLEKHGFDNKTSFRGKR